MQNKDFEFTDSRFFDQISTITDEEIKLLVVTKIEDVAREYQAKYTHLTNKLEFYTRQVNLFEKLCEDGNLLISLEEMNARDMARKLAIVERDPVKVWDALNDAFGYGFFNAVIEREFGITPDFKEYIGKQYAEELNRARSEMNSKVKKIGQSLRNEMDTFRNVMNKKNQEISQLMIAQLNQHEASLEQI